MGWGSGWSGYSSNRLSVATGRSERLGQGVGLLAQLVLGDLVERGPREVVDEVHGTRHLEVRQVLRAEVDDLALELGVGDGIGTLDHEGHRHHVEGRV